VEGRLAGLNGQLSVAQAEGAEYVSKYSNAKAEVAALSRQLDEVRFERQKAQNVCMRTDGSVSAPQGGAQAVDHIGIILLRIGAAAPVVYSAKCPWPSCVCEKCAEL
jgi:hypothetical protein